MTIDDNDTGDDEKPDKYQRGNDKEERGEVSKSHEYCAVEHRRLKFKGSKGLQNDLSGGKSDCFGKPCVGISSR